MTKSKKTKPKPKPKTSRVATLKALPRVTTVVGREDKAVVRDQYDTTSQRVDRNLVGYHIRRTAIFTDGLSRDDIRVLAAGALPPSDLQPVTWKKNGKEYPLMDFNGFVWNSTQCYAKLPSGVRCGRIARRMGPFCAVHSDKLLGLRVRLASHVGDGAEGVSRRSKVPNGLVTTTDFAKGDVVTVLHGERLTHRQADNRYVQNRSNVLQIPYFLWRVNGGEYFDLRQSNCCPGRLIRESHLDYMVPHVDPKFVSQLRNGRAAVADLVERDRTREKKINCAKRVVALPGGASIIEIVATMDIPPGTELVISRGAKWRGALREFLTQRDNTMYKRKGRGRPGHTKKGQKAAKEARTEQRRGQSPVVARRVGDASRLRRSDDRQTARPLASVVPPKRRNTVKPRRARAALQNANFETLNSEGQRQALHQWADSLRKRNAPPALWDEYNSVYRQWEDLNGAFPPAGTGLIMDQLQERANLLQQLEEDKEERRRLGPGAPHQLLQRIKDNEAARINLGNHIINLKRNAYRLKNYQPATVR